MADDEAKAFVDAFVAAFQSSWSDLQWRTQGRMCPKMRKYYRGKWTHTVWTQGRKKRKRVRERV